MGDNLKAFLFFGALILFALVLIGIAELCDRVDPNWEQNKLTPLDKVLKDNYFRYHMEIRNSLVDEKTRQEAMEELAFPLQAILRWNLPDPEEWREVYKNPSIKWGDPCLNSNNPTEPMELLVTLLAAKKGGIPPYLIGYNIRDTRKQNDIRSLYKFLHKFLEESLPEYDDTGFRFVYDLAPYTGSVYPSVPYDQQPATNFMATVWLNRNYKKIARGTECRTEYI